MSPLCPASRNADATPSCFNKYSGPTLANKPAVSPVEWHAGRHRDTAAIQWQHYQKPLAPSLSCQLKVSQHTPSVPGQKWGNGSSSSVCHSCWQFSLQCGLQQAASCPPCLVLICAAPRSSAVNPSLPQPGRGGGCFEMALHRWLLGFKAEFSRSRLTCLYLKGGGGREERRRRRWDRRGAQTFCFQAEQEHPLQLTAQSTDGLGRGEQIASSLVLSRGEGTEKGKALTDPQIAGVSWLLMASRPFAVFSDLLSRPA